MNDLYGWESSATLWRTLKLLSCSWFINLTHSRVCVTVVVNLTFLSVTKELQVQNQRRRREQRLWRAVNNSKCICSLFVAPSPVSPTEDTSIGDIYSHFSKNIPLTSVSLLSPVWVCQVLIERWRHLQRQLLFRSVSWHFSYLHFILPSFFVRRWRPCKLYAIVKLIYSAIMQLRLHICPKQMLNIYAYICCLFPSELVPTGKLMPSAWSLYWLRWSVVQSLTSAVHML